MLASSKQKSEFLLYHSPRLATLGLILTSNTIVLKPRPNDRNMPTQHIATLLGATCCVRLATVLRCVATCWVLLAKVWKWSNLSQQHPTCHNMSQHGGQTHPTSCTRQQCCDMLRWHVAIVWPGLKYLTTILQPLTNKSRRKLQSGENFYYWRFYESTDTWRVQTYVFWCEITVHQYSTSIDFTVYQDRYTTSYC